MSPELFIGILLGGIQILLGALGMVLWSKLTKMDGRIDGLIERVGAIETKQEVLKTEIKGLLDPEKLREILKTEVGDKVSSLDRRVHRLEGRFIDGG